MRYCALFAGLALSGLALSFSAVMPNPAVQTTPTSATPRNLDTHHLFTPPVTKSAWEARKQELRRQILFSAGLWPMPEKTPLNPLVTGKVEGSDYTIENVAIETRPGFYLCGNLYRPKGKRGPFPAIANPHGHWSNGRLEMQADVPKADPSGKMGEGRGNLVAIGVNLARQGFVVFAYDMAGYNDTTQASHKFAGNLDSWLWGVSLFGLQTWNSIRVLDYLESLPYVDKKRLGATGASGGGTQTFILSAIDDRVKVAVPVNMISASMQGGCLCENGPGLRVGTDNVEVGAMFAPKPLLLVAATGDWTKNNPSEEWPAIKRVYDLYGTGDKTAVKQFNYQHNYNVESREAMYAWFGKWFLKDDNAEHFRERPFEVDVKALRVWTAAHPMPSNAMKEATLAQAMKEDTEKRLAAMWPTDPGTLRTFQAAMRPALMTALAIEPGDAAGYASRSGVSVLSLTRRRPANAPMVLLVTRTGNDSMAKQIGDELASKGNDVSILTLRPTGKTASDVWNAYYSCYNRTPLGTDVEAILGGLHTVGAGSAKTIDLVALGDTGPAGLVARGLYGGKGRTVVDAGSLPADDEGFLPALYAPGFRSAGDFRTAAALVNPNPLCLFNAGSGIEKAAVTRTYQTLGGSFKTVTGSMTPGEIATWLTSK
jgi:hypothetical protein